MRVLVTGSKGYCGFGIVKALISGGHQVVGFDRSYPADYQELADYQILLGDLSNFESIYSSLEGIDAIVHSAIFTGDKPVRLFEQPLHPDIELDYQTIRAFEVSDLGTLFLFEAARQHQINKICLLSSGAVIYHHIVDCRDERTYHRVKVSEDSVPSFRGFYGMTKYIQEEIGRFYAKVYNMSVSSMRAWWVVDGSEFINKLGEYLNNDSHPLSPEGLVDRVDLGHACRLSLEKAIDGFKIYYPATGPGCDIFFDVQPLYDQLGWQPEYLFEDLQS